MKSLPLTLSSATLFPVRLVEITRLDGTVKRIAEAEESITISAVSPAQVFVPLDGCEISAVKHTLGGGMPSMSIQFAHSVGGDFDTEDLVNGLYDGASVTLWIADRDNLAAGKGSLPFFTGTIQPVAVDINGSGAFDIRGQAAQAETFIQTYSPDCRTDLFSTLCGLNQANFDYHSTVTSIVDRFNIIIAAPGEGTPTDDFFNLGVIQAASGFKAEIANWTNSTRQITTFLPVCAFGFTVSEAVTLWPGCDKTLATCVSKFNNAVNFQGEPHFLGAAATQGA